MMERAPAAPTRLGCATFPFPPRGPAGTLSDEEIWHLSYYRASEMAGAVVMNKMAARAGDDELRARLTWHFAEEARHAWRWTELLRVLGADPIEVEETYQSNYFRSVGIPRNEIELLAITWVFERRVAWLFAMHRRWPQVHPSIRAVLDDMCSEESPHLHWIHDRLAARQAKGSDDSIAALIVEYEEIDERVARGELKRLAAAGLALPAFILSEWADPKSLARPTNG